MSRSLNRVTLIGNLGADPELRYATNGLAICSLRVATNESYKDNEGNLVEKTEWHRVTTFDKLAEICAEYLKKGSQVFLEGSLQTRSWEDKESGTTKYMTDIRAREMIILGSRGSQYSSEDNDFGQTSEKPRYNKPSSNNRNQTQGVAESRKGGQDVGSGDIKIDDDSDLPF